MAGRKPLYDKQKTREIGILLTEDMHAILRDVASSFGLEPTAYARSLVVTYISKIKQSRDVKAAIND